MSVAVGYLHGEQTAAIFTNSLGAMLWLQAGRSDIRLITDVLTQQSGVNVSHARNELVRRWLDETDAEWLLMLDADMGFKPDLPDALLAMADADPDSPVYTPVIGGLCFGVDRGAAFPTIYGFQAQEDGRRRTVRAETYPAGVMLEVGATGAACLLIHRHAAQVVRENGYNPTYVWFQETEFEGERCGEDITFCIRIRSAGFPVFVHTGIELDHQKAQVVNADLYRSQRAAAGLAAEVPVEFP